MLRLCNAEAAVDHWDQARQAACELLCQLPTPLPGFESAQQATRLASWAAALTASPRVPDADAGMFALALASYPQLTVEPGRPAVACRQAPHICILEHGQSYRVPLFLHSGSGVGARLVRMVFQKYALGLQARVEWSVEAQQQGADKQLEQVGLSKACLGFLDALVARLQVGCQALLISHTQSSQRLYLKCCSLLGGLQQACPQGIHASRGFSRHPAAKLLLQIVD